MAAFRRAAVLWNGNFSSGSGGVNARTSQGLNNIPVSWAARTAEPKSPDVSTSPEELLAAAHASSYVMALAQTLQERGASTSWLEVRAETAFDDAGEQGRIVSSRLSVWGWIDFVDQSGLQSAAEAALGLCAITSLLNGSAEVGVSTSLV
ncbi:MAG: OsmC family peroxiredoxin [Chloroflexi bacterium]|nr:OsmC family peroxiredoxin [Chloroflexota bacterium]